MVARTLARVEIGEAVEVGHELGVHLHLFQSRLTVAPGVFHAKRADQLLDAGVDVGAVEGEYPGLAAGDEILDRHLAVEVAVAAGKLPAAPDDAGYLVAGAQGKAFDRHHPCPFVQAARRSSPRARRPARRCV